MEQDENTNENVGETDQQPCTARCEGCGGRPSWESTFDGWGERWLATCACGRIETFFPDLWGALTRFWLGTLRFEP